MDVPRGTMTPWKTPSTVQQPCRLAVHAGSPARELHLPEHEQPVSTSANRHLEAAGGGTDQLGYRAALVGLVESGVDRNRPKRIRRHPRPRSHPRRQPCHRLRIGYGENTHACGLVQKAKREMGASRQAARVGKCQQGNARQLQPSEVLGKGQLHRVAQKCQGIRVPGIDLALDERIGGARFHRVLERKVLDTEVT